MKNKLHIHYDEEADFFEFRVGKPTASVYEDIGDDIFKRIDEKSREVKGFAIFNFKKRTEKLKDVEVPLPVSIKLSS